MLVSGGGLGRVVEFEQGLRWRVWFPHEEHVAASSFLRDLAASGLFAGNAAQLRLRPAAVVPISARPMDSVGARGAD